MRWATASGSEEHGEARCCHARTLPDMAPSSEASGITILNCFFGSGMNFPEQERERESEGVCASNVVSERIVN